MVNFIYMLRGQKQKGFTIVELLIVVVVIAILATITIVAYNGIQNRAKLAAAQSTLVSANKKINTYAIDHGDNYPDSLETAGIKSDGLQYSSNNNVSPKTYGLTVTTGTTSFYLSNTVNSPTSGSYVGHSNGGAPMITNLLTNPSFTTAMTGWSSLAGTGGTWTNSRPTTGGADNGPYAMYTYTALPTSSSYLSKGSGTASDANRDTVVSGGEAYTASAYIRASWATTVSISFLTYDGAGVSTGSNSGSSVTLTPNTWTRISATYTMPAGAATTVIRLYSSGSTLPPSTGSTLAFDQVMVTQGTTLYTYADGNIPGWSWSGTANASSSSGYAL